MYLQRQENKKEQSSVMNSVPQESNTSQTSNHLFPPPLHSHPPPNLYHSPYNYVDNNTFLNPVPTAPFYVPPYPPPNFPVNKQLSTPAQKNLFHCDVEAPSFYGYHQDTKTLGMLDIDEASSNLEKNKVFNQDTWLTNWLSGVKGHRAENFSFQQVKINDAKESFKRSIYLLKELAELKQKMEYGLENTTNSEWNSLCSEFIDKKKDVMSCISKLPDKDALKIIVAKRTKKRNRQRRRKKERKVEKIQGAERRQQLHHQIDTWMKGMQETIDNKKREVSLKKEADSILSEVLRKKADGRRQLALVTALVKLRQLRAKSAANRGQLVPIDNGIKFSKVAENLKALWEKQLKEYDVEENGMRVMLSEAVDERDQSQVLRDRQIFSEWNKLLFGSNATNIPEFFLSANQNVESFINIRQAWDKFVMHSETSVQSNIPVGWVLPSNPSSAWEKLLK